MGRLLKLYGKIIIRSLLKMKNDKTIFRKLSSLMGAGTVQGLTGELKLSSKGKL
jgi:hypothetical protein